jgi:hypothetical protein
MDIITVTHSRLKASLDEAVFDINSVLELPAEEGSNRRFSNALQKYTQAATQLETLDRLQKEIAKSNDQQEETGETKAE